MTHKVLLHQPKKCIGCRLCEQICSMTHYNATNPKKARIRIIRDHEAQLEKAKYCHNCRDPPCIKACNFEALSRDNATLAIRVNEQNCIACKMCIEECPFDAPIMHPTENYILICDLCGGHPACVDICPEHAIQYLEIERAEHIYRADYENNQTHNLLKEMK